MGKNKLITNCRKGLPKLNITYYICDHLIGESHKVWHRLLIGTLFLLGGTGLILINNSIPALIFTHSTGVIIEAIGVIPWIELIIKERDNLNNKN